MVMNYALFNGKSEVLRNQTSTFLRVFLLAFCLIGGINFTYAQCPAVAEICGNGIDDDGDGLTDCADSDCSASADCTGTLTCPADVLTLTEEVPIGDGIVIADVWEDNAAADLNFAVQFPDADALYTLADGTPLPYRNAVPDAGDDTDLIPTLGFLDNNINGDAGATPDEDEPAVLATPDGKEAAQSRTMLIIPPNLTCIDFQLNPGAQDAARLYLGGTVTTMELVAANNANVNNSGSFTVPADAMTITNSCGTEYAVIFAVHYHNDDSQFAATQAQWDLGDGFEFIDPSYYTSDIANVEFVESKRTVYRDADDMTLFDAGTLLPTIPNSQLCEPGTEEICVEDSSPFCECTLGSAEDNAVAFSYQGSGYNANNPAAQMVSFTNECTMEANDYTITQSGGVGVSTSSDALLIDLDPLAAGECGEVTIAFGTPTAPKFEIRDIDGLEAGAIYGTLNGIVVKPIILPQGGLRGVALPSVPATFAGEVNAEANFFRTLAPTNREVTNDNFAVEVYFTGPIDELVLSGCRLRANKGRNIFFYNFRTCCENTVALCNDGVDNDGDGVSDCGDPKCAGLADDCFIPCPAEDRAPIRTWNLLSAADRTTLQDGGTVTEHPTGFCDPIDDMPVTVDITSSAAPDAPNSATINAKLPRLAGRQSFRIGRETPGMSGVQYCYDFSKGTNFLIDSREHAFFGRSENIVITASYFDVPVNLIGEWGNPAQAGPATITGNATDKVTFSANGKSGSGLWWRLGSENDEPIDQICVQYFRTDNQEISGAEPFRLQMCGDVCPDFVEPVIICEDSQPITRWNALTGTQRAALNDTDPTTNAEEFNSGFCTADGLPLFMDIETSGAQNSAQPNNINNKPPRRAFNASFFDGRSDGGASGNENCFVFEEAVPFRVDSREHSVFNGAERIVVTAFAGADPVIITGEYTGAAGPAIITGSGTTEITFNANGKIGPGLSWEASSGDEPVTKICVQYYRTGGAFTGVEPYRVSICNTDRCVFDDPFAIAERDLGDGELAGELPAGTLADQLAVSKSIAGIEQAASGVPGNIDLTFRITATNNGTEILNNLQLIDNIENAISPEALIGFISGTVDAASTATANPTVSGTYDGATDDEVLVGIDGTLAVGETLIIDLVFEVDASALLPNEQFTNQALVTGENPDGTLATAASDADGEVGDTGGNIDPTLVYVPAVNLTKALLEDFPVQSCQGVGNVNARFELTLENTGNVDVTNVQIVDDLIGQLGSAFIDISFIQYTEITASSATIDPILNNGFNDNVFESTIFDGTSGLLEPGQSITVQFIAIINPDAPDAAAVLTNQAEVTANGVNPADGSVLLDPNTGAAYVATDLSDDGTDPNSLNPDALGDLGTQNDPTPINGGSAVGLGSIGLVKTTTNVVPATIPGNINVTYQLILANLGGSEVTNIQITDNAAQQLGAAYVGFVSGPSVIGGGATVNSEFNAGFEPDVFDGTTGSLNPGETMTVTFTVEVNPSAVTDPMTLTNQALATVSTGGNLLADLSDSGSNPASSNLGAMGDTGCSDDPTPVFGNFPVIMQAPMDMCVESYGVGSTPLNNWIGNNGNLEIITPESCMPAVITNDYSPDNFVSTCSQYNGSVLVNFYYSDACGNSYDFSATFELKDTTAPSCVKPFDLTIACDDPDFDATVESYAGYWGPVTDLSHPITIESSYSEDGFDDNGQQTIVWTFTDACGNSREWDALLTITGDCSVEECTASAGTLTINTSPVELSNGSATVSATANGDAVVPSGYSTIYVLTSGEDLVIQQVNADAPTFEVTSAGNYTIHTLVYDAVTLDLSIVVPDVTTGFDVFGLTQAGGGTICASLDAAGASVNVNEVIEELCTASAGTSTINTSPVELSNGSATVSATSNGDAIVPAGYSTLYVLTSGEDLVIQQVNANAPTFEVTSAGNYTIHTLVYDAATLDLSIVVPGVTTGFDVFGLTQAGGGTICASLDAGGASVTVDAEIVTPPTELTVTPPTDLNLDCTDAVPGVGVEATTTCADGLINITDTEVVTSMGCPGSFTIVRTYHVSDNCGNSETVTQTIIVTDNTAPVFSSVPANADVDCTGYPDGFGTPVIADACGSVSLIFEDNLAPYICDADFNITRTWTATDECGNVATASQTLTVWPDVESPLFSFVPGDMTINCGDAVVFGTPAISDGCTGFTLTEDVTATGACPNGYTTTKTWTAVDGCGNASVQSQTITVLAAPAPITLGFTFVPENKIVECGDAVEFGEPVCAGNCDDGFVITIEDITTASEVCVNTPILIRRWTATDACDNVVTAEQVITIVDTTVPEFTNVPADKLVACGESILFDEPVALDLCGGVSLTFIDETEWANCEGVAYSVTRNWIAVDACGNTATFANTISVEEDATAPVLSALEDKVVSCSEGIIFDTPVVTDNCDYATLSYSDAIIENDCEIVHTRTWVAADGCNNISETVQKITVIDDVSPTFNIESNSISMPAFAYQSWIAPEVFALDECSNVEAKGPFVFDYGNGRIDHSWTTIDACGNKASVTVTVNIITVIFPGGNLEMTPLTVFPNPTGGKLTLSFGAETESTATVIVTDILGRTYVTQKAATYVGKNVIRLDLGDLPQGTYLVKVNDGTQEMTDTFIKF